jgi:hypothetical protein
MQNANELIDRDSRESAAVECGDFWLIFGIRQCKFREDTTAAHFKLDGLLPQLSVLPE